MPTEINVSGRETEYNTGANVAKISTIANKSGKLVSSVY